MNRQPSPAFAPFTTRFIECEEFGAVFVALVASKHEIVHIGEYNPETFELLLDNGKEIQCISEADVRRVITELGIRGEFDNEIYDHNFIQYNYNH